MIINNTSNYIDISQNTKDKLIKFLECFFEYVEEQYDAEEINPKYYCDLLLVISEAYPLLENKDKWEQIGYDICKGLKQDIEKYGIPVNNIGMIGGLGYMCFCINLYNKRTGNLANFSKTLNRLFLEKAINFVQNREIKTDLDMNDYDIIYGVSGFLYYLLDFQWDTDDIIRLKQLIKYLVGLTSDYEYEQHSCIKFHLKDQKKVRDDGKPEFPNGNINFGLAHGMIGPLIALTKACNKGVMVEGMEYAINRLFELYDKFKIYKNNNIAAWPTQLSFEDYIKGKFSDNLRPIMASWCYGNIGIARGLQKSAKYMNYAQKEKVYIEDLVNIFNQPVDQYNLYEAILCHGYASVLCIRMMTYRDSKDKRFIELVEKDIESILDRIPQSHDGNYDMNKVIEEHFKEDVSFLMGTTGVILSLVG
ncbi:MAG: lanthionine synthetase C family protein, partial [Tissierella sp.]|nr:lanthionine synthetase C family protein [Tissierella sp.]